MKKNHYIHNAGLILLHLLDQAKSAWALQSPKAPEGLYVLQVTQLLSMGGLVYLSWHTHHSPFLINKGGKTSSRVQEHGTTITVESPVIEPKIHKQSPGSAFLIHFPAS